LLVLVAVAPLPVAEPEPFDPVPVALPLAEVLVDAAKKISVDWNVRQLDEAGTRGVYGGGAVNVAGIDHVETTPLVVYTPTTS